MHLSGIATFTDKFAKAVLGAHPIKECQILDTRKTLPGYRELEKRAVVHGGGHNHRLNLSTGVLVKDNHIAVMKGISLAVERIRNHTKLPVEVEVSTLEDVQECIDLKIERILLDNMSNETMSTAIAMVNKSSMANKMLFEASGNMNLERVRSVAALGVDFISVGALTHSAPSADLSLLFDWENT
jgi:nicotinate-nucleotide pyrophosphorylase (carboxylating)